MLKYTFLIVRKQYSDLRIFKYHMVYRMLFFRRLPAVFRDNKLLTGVERLADHPPLVGAVVRPIPEAIVSCTHGRRSFKDTNP
jgi:hypothetical protein